MPAFRHGLPSLFVFLSLGAAAQATETPAFIGEADCRIAPLKPLPTRIGVKWSGACKDSYADGKGVLEWYGPDKGKRRIEGTLVRGEISGEGTLTNPSGKYTGTFRQGLPHGAGFFDYSNGKARYEGGFVDGRREGSGMVIARDRSTYEGEWKAGKRHGRGKAVYTLGGSYDGQWRDDAFNGQGHIVYGGSGRTWTGEFRDGRAVDAIPLPSMTGEKDDLRRTVNTSSMALLERRGQVVEAIPLDREWEQLTPAQRILVRAGYPALDDLDEPPYPLKGSQEIHQAITDLYARYNRYEGDVMLHIVVGADGVPKTVNTYGVPHPDLGRFLAMAMMTQRYKPALCAGTPCEMIFPIMFSFKLDN
jgi:hypothetical protein